MKYIRLFEFNKESKPKYNPGDYVILKGTGWNSHNCVKIVRISKDDLASYYLKSYSKYNGNEIKFWMGESEIERLATDEEVKELELFVIANKYNI